MPLPGYGVLIGTLIRFAREDPDNFGSWYHGKLYVQTPAGQYEGAIDVSTPAGIKVQYRVVPDLSRRLFASILALPSGWHLLATNASSGALDYLRSPLLRNSPGCVAVVASPLIDLINAFFRSPQFGWIESTGDNALDVLEANLTGSQRLFVFGAPYNTGLGVHDIHMNQGDPPGQFQHLDGIWQDGGTIIERPGGELVAVLTKFATQSFQTDDQGLPV